MENAAVDRLAQKIWDYHHLNQSIGNADLLLVLGGHDLRVPEYAVELYSRGLAPFIVISGGLAHVGDMLETSWNKTEASKFAEVMESLGIHDEKIVLEEQAKNTGENFEFSRRVLEGMGRSFTKVLVVTKPYMERRAYATGRKLWPDKDIIVTSPPMPFDRYVVGDISKDDIINLMVGDLQRIDVYGRKGFQIEQEIPDDVRSAFEDLKKLGYTKHLLQES